MSSRRRPVARATILAASSAASVPELVNRTRCTEGTRAASSSARATWWGCGLANANPCGSRSATASVTGPKALPCTIAV